MASVEANGAPIATVRGKSVAREIAAAMDWNNATLIGRTITIDKPRAEVFAFWRDLPNLAAFMENIERIDVIDQSRSHWVVAGPNSSHIEWDAEITEEAADSVLAWRSLEDAEVKNIGRVVFRDAPGGRGTQLSAIIAYEAPGGALGKAIAKLFGADPKVQTHRDLRRLKQLLETGEISTTQAPDAAPRSH